MIFDLLLEVGVLKEPKLNLSFKEDPEKFKLKLMKYFNSYKNMPKADSQ